MNVSKEVKTNMYKNESFTTANTSEYHPIILESEEEYIEVYNLEVKIAFVTLACVSLLSSLTAITLMHRSKKIPYAAKFLSTGLLSFDVLFIVTSTFRKFVTDHVISLNVQTAVTLYLQLAVFTVGLMSLERYFLIIKPMRYINIVTKKFIQKTVLSIWLCETSLSIFIRYGVCYIRYRTSLVFTEASYCNRIMSSYYAIMLFIVLVTSCTCYVKIFSCIRSKLKPGNSLSVAATAKRILSYRSTSLVFLYLSVITATSVAYAVIIILIQIENLRYTQLRLGMEAVSIFNCILDPFLYVLWFKECRLQLLTFLAVFLKRYRRKAEEMKIELYNIVTREVPVTETANSNRF